MTAETAPPLPSLSQVLRQYNLQPQKNLGQNFILDGNRLAKIARLAGDLSKTTVIEVGPGPGGLTRALLAAGAQSVIAIEKDERCLGALEDINRAIPGRLTVISADALTTNWAALGPPPRLIVANLPYHISVPLLLQWLQEIHLFSHLVLMFQKEVADRLSASPETKAYGRLSVMTQWKTKVTPVLKLPPDAFFPSPKVFSTVVRLDPLPNPFSISWDAMERVTAAAFQQRRKMLRSSLKTLWPDPLPFLGQAQIDPTRRGETLSVEEFYRLALCV